MYGCFSEDGREYIATRLDTPRPWLHFMSNDEYGMGHTQNGFGYSFYKSAFDVKVSYTDIFGYVPTHPQTGKFVYLHDADSGRAWSLAPLSVKDKHKNFQCRYGLGYQTISASHQGIEGELSFLVPRAGPVELWRIRLRNVTNRKRRIRFFPYVELAMGCDSKNTDVLTFTRGGFDRKLDTAVMRMTNSTSPFTYDAFMLGDYPVQGFDCRRDSFLGVARGIQDPLAPEQGACANSSVSAEPMCLVMAGELTLKPGEEKTTHVVMGVSRKPSDISRWRKRYAAPGAWDREMRKVNAYWDDAVGRVSVDSPSALFDLQMNVWIKYQNYVTSRWVRGNDKGYRDVLQDVMGYTVMDPAWCRHWLSESLKAMFASGLCPRCFNHYGGSDDLRLHRDSPAWIPLTLDQYLRETGDFDLLQERLPFRDEGEGSVWDHVLRGLNRLWSERGRDGLCKIGDGDWNDSLDEVAPEGRGQSAWLTIATVYAMRVTAGIARAAGLSKDAALLTRRATRLSKIVNAKAWDGNWYIYAIDDHGRPIGSRANRQGKIHLNCQTWAVFSGVAADGGRLKQVLATIDKRLATPYGPLLMHPAYTGYVRGIGKVSAKNPGMAENGPMYMHGAAFKIMADCTLGRGDEAFDTFQRVLPQSPWNKPAWHGGEPFASHRYLIGPGCQERFGQAAYPWFCAWQAWMMGIGFERMAGVRPSYRELIVDPCLPRTWRRLRVTRHWRGAVYEIEIRNPHGAQSGVAELYCDGRKLSGNAVPAPSRPGERHTVRAVMG